MAKLSLNQGFQTPSFVYLRKVTRGRRGRVRPLNPGCFHPWISFFVKIFINNVLLEPSYTHIFTTLSKEKLNMRGRCCIVHKHTQKYHPALYRKRSPTSVLNSSKFSPFENNTFMTPTWINFPSFWLLSWNKLPEVSMSQQVWWLSRYYARLFSTMIIPIPTGFGGVWKWKWKLLSHVQLFATPWTIQSMEFSRPEYWSG